MAMQYFSAELHPVAFFFCTHQRRKYLSPDCGKNCNFLNFPPSPSFHRAARQVLGMCPCAVFHWQVVGLAKMSQLDHGNPIILGLDLWHCRGSSEEKHSLEGRQPAFAKYPQPAEAWGVKSEPLEQHDLQHILFRALLDLACMGLLLLLILCHLLWTTQCSKLLAMKGKA